MHHTRAHTRGCHEGASRPSHAPARRMRDRVRAHPFDRPFLNPRQSTVKDGSKHTLPVGVEVGGVEPAAEVEASVEPAADVLNVEQSRETVLRPALYQRRRVGQDGAVGLRRGGSEVAERSLCGRVVVVERQVRREVLRAAATAAAATSSLVRHHGSAADAAV
jgi:hypothetical protein